MYLNIRHVCKSTYSVVFLPPLPPPFSALILPPLSSHLKSLGLASWQRGFVLSSYGVLQFVSGPVVGAVSDAGDRKLVFLACVVCTGQLRLYADLDL